ncbi:hypothetical protein NDU88_004648 [Pleurodeles waltl]|uniref:Lamina-associated polypeptide 2 alpha C-terminal domain-containing protein n=1 Tax=Pleurodeles waltl TaxID=8319 RepID=A0AAV7N3L7_PLEWA|nr:hypothetical protein NDU88_004648 [Pleurodeles waltl]
MASSGLAVRKLADGELLLMCLALKQCCVLEFGRWAAGPVLCSWLGRLQAAEEVIKQERRDPDKILLPLFMAKLYPLQDMAQVLPDLVPIDSFVTSLVGRTSLAEDAVIWDVSLKKAYAGTHLALRAGIYGTYVAQSLLSDLKALNSALDGSSGCSGLMSFIEGQVEFLLDISFDVVQTSALAEGACVSASRNLVLQDWKTDAAQKTSALRFPFQGNVLFGAELEDQQAETSLKCPKMHQDGSETLSKGVTKAAEKIMETKGVAALVKEAAQHDVQELPSFPPRHAEAVTRRRVFFRKRRRSRAPELAEQTGTDALGRTTPRRDAKQTRSETGGRRQGEETERTDRPRSGKSVAQEGTEQTQAGHRENRDLD